MTTNGIPRVVVVGDVNPDMTIRLSRSGGSGRIDPTPPEVGGGGTAGNAAVALARLGISTAFVGAIGEDPFGRLVEAELRAEGIDLTGVVHVSGHPTALVVALIQADGERHLLNWPPERGADIQLRPQDLNPAWFAGAAWVHATGICLRHSPVREAVVEAMRLGRAAGATVSVDLNLRAEVWGMDPQTQASIESAIALADVVLGSGPEELTLIAGLTDPQAAARRIAAGVRTVVGRVGAEGAFCVGREAPQSVSGFSVPVVDATGAGDAFNGGFIAARVEGACLREALRWGNAVAALKISRGAARALPNRRDVLEFLGSHL